MFNRSQDKTNMNLKSISERSAMFVICCMHTRCSVKLSQSHFPLILRKRIWSYIRLIGRRAEFDFMR